MAFDENNAAWANEFKELYVTLSPEEYRAAKESTLTAFYTPPIVIKAMYEALDRLGFSEGNILEPSCGTGNFFGLLPDSMEKSKLHGVEIDSLTGRIAKQLYQKANIAIEGFEKTKLPDDYFDVVLGNVPFGDFRVNDSRYNAQNFRIHDYFFAKALDKARAGGVVMFITSRVRWIKRVQRCGNISPREPSCWELSVCPTILFGQTQAQRSQVIFSFCRSVTE